MDSIKRELTKKGLSGNDEHERHAEETDMKHRPHRKDGKDADQ